jgi:hypothetical protein
LPVIGFVGFLRSEFYEIWRSENVRVFADLARQPKPAAIPAPVRAALPAPKPKAPVAAAEVAPRAVREPIRDSAPADDGERLVTILRSGVEVENRQLAVGDIVRVGADLAGKLLRSGAAELAREKANG